MIRRDEIENRASLGFVVNEPDVLDAIAPHASRHLVLRGISTGIGLEVPVLWFRTQHRQ
jgi:hypothetical protein